MDVIAREEVLAHTLATDFVPGSNVRGDVAGAAWRYLLPTLVRDRVVCVGRPPRGTLRTLRTTSREVILIAAPGRAAEPDVRVVAPTTVLTWLAAEPDTRIDLIWVAAGGGGLDDPGAAALGRHLTEDAIIVSEHRDAPAGPDPASAALPATVRAMVGDRATAWLRVRPDRGEIRSAVAVGDAASSTSMRERGLAGPAIRWAGPRRIGRLLDRLIGSRRPRWLAVSGPAGASLPPAPPAYLAALAAEAGMSVTGWRCALSAIGDYNTQKVLALLTPPGASAPAVIVKMTRDASVVARLETERDALRALAALGVAEGRVPRVLFAGRHAGLAIVGESVVDGRPFDRERGHTATTGHGGGPGLHPVDDAVGWLTDLAVRSARPADPADVADAMGDLLARFVAACRPERALVERLEAAVAALRQSGRPLPLVFQHGDPGTWNMLVREDGSAAILDWENADQAGMPLWDLFYLLRSHAVGTGHRAGTMRRLAAVERYLFDASPLSDMVVTSVHAYADRVGVQRELVEPLFHLCWMHQALKEATRMAPERVSNGHYNRLLRLGLERRAAPTLRRLFEGSA
jgi:hypothetical protein